MPNYIMLANFTERGRRMGRSNPHLLTEAAARSESASGHVLTQYAVLGRYDFVIIAEATDNQSAVRLSLELSSLAGMNIETLPALPIGVLSEEERAGVINDTAVAMSVPDGQADRDNDAWRIPASPE